MAEFRPVNLAEIYGQIDAARANQAAMQNNAMMQERQRRQFAMEDEALAEQRALKDVYGRSIDNVDGMPQVNEKRLLSEMIRINPAKAMELQDSFSKRNADALKLKSETAKEELENRKATAAYLRDRLAGVQDQATYDAVMQEATELGAGFVKGAPREFNPEFVRGQLFTADEFLKQSTPKYEKVDLGGKIQIIDTNPVTNPSIKGTSLDKTATIGERESMRHNRVQEGISGATLGLQRDRLAFDKLGGVTGVNAQNKPAAKTPLSATAQKELFEADEMVQASRNALGMLREAKRLNQTAYSGIGAKPRAVIASNLGMGSGGADDTINLDNLMTGQALESLKATFGGMPTEGERKILLEIQASADKTPSQRKAILDRAEQAAQRRIKFNEKKANALRSGTYFTEQQQPQQDIAPTRDVRSEADKILGL